MTAQQESRDAARSVARDLARWAVEYEIDAADAALASRSLADTVAVAVAGLDHPVVRKAAPLGVAGRLATAAHILDFDDLHLPSTSHISAVIVSAVLATRGAAREYLAGAGVMARIGALLGWSHYDAGWHATCTAGAPAAAVAAALSMGLDEDQVMHAMLLALPGAGGVQHAFGTDGKSLQVGMATDAGVRAAELAALGARSAEAAFDQWLVVHGAGGSLAQGTRAVPDGLAIKLYPCCYAMQRPISAIRAIADQVRADDVVEVVVRAPRETMHPLIYAAPTTGLESKFSLEYACAVALLDGFPGFDSFTDEAVRRPRAVALMRTVRFAPEGTSQDLLGGVLSITVTHRDGSQVRTSMEEPPGGPGTPPTAAEMADKLTVCGLDPAAVDGDWSAAAEMLTASSR